MSAVNSSVVDLVAADSSGSKQPKPSFSIVKWKQLKPTDPIVTEFAVWYYKKPIDQIPKDNLSRLQAMLCCFTLSQLQLAFGFLGGDSEDLPTTKRSARKAVISLILAKNYLSNSSGSKSSPSPTVASVNTVVTLSPTKRGANSDAASRSAVKEWVVGGKLYFALWEPFRR